MLSSLSDPGTNGHLKIKYKILNFTVGPGRPSKGFALDKKSLK